MYSDLQYSKQYLKEGHALMLSAHRAHVRFDYHQYYLGGTQLPAGLPNGRRSNDGGGIGACPRSLRTPDQRSRCRNDWSPRLPLPTHFFTADFHGILRLAKLASLPGQQALTIRAIVPANAQYVLPLALAPAYQFVHAPQARAASQIP